MVNVEIKTQKLDYSGAEAYKSLRTNLQFCGEDKKVIAITSCTPNEGKSSVTMNLAVSLADAGKKVLLIDADLRKSGLVGRTKVKESIKGLTHYLSKTGGAYRGNLRYQCKKSAYCVCGTSTAKSGGTSGGKTFS